MLFENNSQVVLDGFMIQFNKNTFGLAAAGPLQVTLSESTLCLKLRSESLKPISVSVLFQIPPLQPGTSARIMLPMVLFQNMSAGPPSSLLQVAVKNNQQPVWYFTDKIILHALFGEDGRMERGTFLEVT